MTTNLTRLFVFSLMFWVQFTMFAQKSPSKRQFEKEQDQFIKVVMVGEKKIPQKRIPSYFFPPAKTLFDNQDQAAVLKLQILLDSIFLDYTRQNAVSKFLTQIEQSLYFDSRNNQLVKHRLVYDLALNITPYQEEFAIYQSYFRSKELAQFEQERAIRSAAHLQSYKRYLTSTYDDDASATLDKIEEYAYEFRDSTTLRENLLQKWSHNHKHRYRVRRLFEKILPTLKDDDLRIAQQAHEQRTATWASEEQQNSVLPLSDAHSSENNSSHQDNSATRHHDTLLEKSLAEKEQLRRQRSRSKSRHH